IPQTPHANSRAARQDKLPLQFQRRQSLSTATANHEATPETKQGMPKSPKPVPPDTLSPCPTQQSIPLQGPSEIHAASHLQSSPRTQMQTPDKLQPAHAPKTNSHTPKSEFPRT